MGVGQPGVHRPHRHLHGEGCEEGTEQEGLRRGGQGQLVPVGDLEGTTRLVVQEDQRDEHQQRAQQRVQEELERGIDAARTAPHTDDDVHRDQRGFEEHVEQQAVQRREHADRQAGQDQEGAVVLVRSVFDDLPAGQHHDDGDEGRQGHKPHRDAIDTQVVEDIEALDPGRLLDELHRGSAVVKARHHRDGDEEADDRADQGDPAGRAAIFLTAHGQQEDTEGHGQPDGQGEDGRHGLHGLVLALRGA